MSGKVLITGAAGGLSRIVAEHVANKHEVVGVDTRELPEGARFPGEFHRLDYAHRRMADVFRNGNFESLLHLGRLSIGNASMSRTERFNVNVLGTQSLLNAALKYGVKQIVVLSTFHVYGAHKHNPIHLTESDPLRASQIFPELADAIELDHVSRVFMHQYRRIRTVILRPANIVGPRIFNRTTQMLRAKRCPILLGYDPVLQFLHEEDAARAVIMSLEGKTSGIYNVAGEGAIAFSRAIQAAGSTPLPIPHFLAYPAVDLLSKTGLLFPKHLIDYFRYPTIMADDLFRKQFGYQPAVSTLRALASIGNPNAPRVA